MARGDHIRVKRGFYWHHGIDCGDGTVIHYSGDLKNKRNASIERASLEQFAKSSGVEAIEVVRHRDCDPPDEVMRRAVERLGESGYSFVWGNCEHFAHWCKTGRKKSMQVRAAGMILGVATGVIAVALPILARVLSRRAARRV